MLLLLSLLISAGAASGTPKEVCFGSLGCFRNDGPFDTPAHRPKSVLPKGPAEIDLAFRLYSRKAPSTGLELKTSNQSDASWANIDGSLPFKFVVHGFKAKGKSISFLKRYKQAFLTRSRVNVVLVTWVKGASLPYWQAVANTRVVGAALAVLIRLLQERVPGFHVSKVHLIGHSLGAHICGYAGQRFQSPKVARITGLDPAGPYFRGTQPPVRLDRSDAAFVDTVNTNGGSILKLKLGIFYPIGHANFYVNGGRSQPGCQISTAFAARAWFQFFKGRKKKLKALVKKFTCSHTFAHRIFEFTLSPSDRPLTAFRCDNYTHFRTGACLDCSRPGRCVPFGLPAQKPASGPAQFFLQSGATPNFSGTHLGFKFKMAAGTKKRKGRFFVRFNYESGTTSNDLALPSTKKWFKLKPSKALKGLAFLPGKLEAVKSISFRWQRHKSAWHVGSWFGNGKTKIDRVDVFNAVTQETISFCTGQLLRTKKTYKMTIC